MFSPFLQRTLWHYHHFCDEAGAPYYPGDPKLLGACLSLRASTSQSISMVNKLYSSVVHEHKKRFLTSPTEHPSIHLLMQSIWRHLARPRQPVQPIEPDHLLLMNKHHYELKEKASLELWRTIWRANIQYYSACHFSEINSLTHAELTLAEAPSRCLILEIKRSKTDEFQRGHTKYLYPVKSEPLLCPLQLTEKYLQRLGSHLPPGQPYQGYLQPRVRLDKHLGRGPPKICYSSCLEETRQLFQSLQIPGRFGEHSGRRGAATQAAANGGSLLEIQTLGYWKSSTNAQL